MYSQIMVERIEWTFMHIRFGKKKLNYIFNSKKSINVNGFFNSILHSLVQLKLLLLLKEKKNYHWLFCVKFWMLCLIWICKVCLKSLLFIFFKMVFLWLEMLKLCFFHRLNSNNIFFWKFCMYFLICYIWLKKTNIWIKWMEPIWALFLVQHCCVQKIQQLRNNCLICQKL